MLQMIQDDTHKNGSKEDSKLCFIYNQFES